MSYKRIIAGLRHRIVELRRNLDKVREERDEAREKLKARQGIPGTDREVVPAGDGVGFVIRRRRYSGANGLERLAAAGDAGRFDGINRALPRGGIGGNQGEDKTDEPKK